MTSDMLSPEEYLTRVLAALTPLDPVEVPLERAHGLVLAEDVRSAVPVPPWTNSAMDGYAVRAADVAGAHTAAVTLPVAGDVPAGAAPGPLAAGTAQRIMTGAMLPEGADAVVRVEDTDQPPGAGPLPERVEVRTAVAPGTNVRHAGEDVAVGDLVLARGTVLKATAVSAAAAVGRRAVRAVPRPRVAVVVTGAELAGAGRDPAAGTIPDSNGPLLSGLVAEHGARLTSVARSVDTPAALADALRAAAVDADLIITSGGVSVGAFDPFTALADARGQVNGPSGNRIELATVKVAMQPGKPQGYGAVRTRDGRRVPVIGLPGNPVSVLVSFTTIVAPALARLSGHETGAGLDASGGIGMPTTMARAAVGWRGPLGRRQHVPVRFVAPPEPLPAGAAPEAVWVAPSHRLGSGSHLVASLPAAQALAVVEADVDAVAVGDPVRLLALSAPSGPVQYSIR
ncbi:molybdopterin molybdotransferase [Actinomyces ruminicola]|uniref:Molybdopterin molybdenumtransferase n=1 Tax=Actinomyces ruminicola TaxID=332524 RepID=A0A1H0DMI6_9ACTO|nr:gephyrin-like molybdotransferase Glp [Actinomyces ruminicola]SDN71288.1 molybdopterin molybdotransferase [Actinomyces ruminicola]